jgi:hypothetical protein
MMPRQNTMVSLSIVAVMSLFTQVHASDNPRALQTNPFSNPHISEKETTNDHAKTAIPPVVLELRGIIIAGSNSQANIGGTILAIGEDIEGYTLVSVKQRHVVLDKDGAQKTLSLDPDDSLTAAQSASYKQ